MRIYVPDGPIPTGVEDALELAWTGDGTLLCPELLLAEAAQVLWKKEKSCVLRAEECDEVFQAILALPLEVYAHRALLPRARYLARRSKLTVYDALYLALALEQNAEVLTADTLLMKAYLSAKAR